MAEMPWFPLYAADFMIDTATWSNEELGAYFRLLCHQWVNGDIPVQGERLARLVSETPERLADLWTALGPKFQDTGDGRLQNARLERERRKQATQSQARSERARKAAAVRWGDECSEECSEECVSNASQSQSQKLETETDPQYRLATLASCPETPANSGRTGQAQEVVVWIPISGPIPKALSHGPVRSVEQGGNEFGVTLDRAEEWAQLYPALDVRQELREIRSWNLARPRHRKTYPKGGGSGVLGHIDSWLRKSQNKSRPDRATRFPGRGTVAARRETDGEPSAELLGGRR